MRRVWICGAAFVAMSWGAATVEAAPLPALPNMAPQAVELAQGAYNSRPFRRCMRAKYGPRYFSRVPRAHRWHMAQACLSQA